MGKKELLPFFFVGYYICYFTNVSYVLVAVLGLVAAIIYCNCVAYKFEEDEDDDDDDTEPILGIYDHTFAQELKPYIDRLEAANGLIECPQAKKLALDIKQENKDAAKLMFGVEYLTARKGGEDCYNGWEFTTALRSNF